MNRSLFLSPPGFDEEIRERFSALHALVAIAERNFFYLPFMHSELLDDQERCMALFAAWRDELPDAHRGVAAQGYDFAVRHRDIVARFGRFPHRNALVGRASTPEELAFLSEPGSSF